MTLIRTRLCQVPHPTLTHRFRQLHQLAKHVVGACLRLLDARDVLRAGDDHVVGERVLRDLASVVAHHRDREHLTLARLGERVDDVQRVARGRERERGVARSPVRDHLALEDRLDPDVVGDRGDDRGVLGEVERAPRLPVPSGSGTRKSAATSIASVAEPPLPNARSRPPDSNESRSAAAAAVSSSRLSASVCSRSAPISSALRSDGGAHVGDDRLELGLRLGEERVEEAGRAGIVDLPRLAPLQEPAVVEEDVDQLPEQVVERLDQLLADEGVEVRTAAGTPIPLRTLRRRRSSGIRRRGRG